MNIDPVVTTGMTSVMTVFSSLIGGLTTVVSTVTASGNDILLFGIGAAAGSVAIKWFKGMTGQRSGRRR